MSKRASLTPRERRAMWEDQDRLCALCCQYIDLHDCIAEHWNQVALGNEEKPDYLLCIPCAHRKTYGTKATSYGSDAHARAKIKRLRGETKQGPKKAIPSRPFSAPPPGHTWAWPTRKFPGRPL